MGTQHDSELTKNIYNIIYWRMGKRYKMDKYLLRVNEINNTSSN